MRIRATATALTLLAVGATEGRAQTRPPLRVVVRAASAPQRELVQRIIGQTAELPVALVVEPSAALESDLSAQLDQAEALATRHRAAVVVWLDIRAEAGAARTSSRIFVHVAGPGTGRILVRTVDTARAGDRAAAGPGSAALEAAALVVRTALVALAAGGEIGVRRAELEAQAPAAAAQAPAAGATAAPASGGQAPASGGQAPAAGATAPAPAAGAQAPASGEATPGQGPAATARGAVAGQTGDEAAGAGGRGARSLRASLGAVYLLDGLSSGQGGVALRVGVGLGERWEVGVGGVTTFAARVEDALTTIALAERYAGPYASVRVPLGDTLALGPRLTVGAGGFWRSTEAQKPGVVASAPVVTPTLAVVPALGLDWTPRVLGGALGLSAAAELGYFPGAPRLRYEAEPAGARPADRQVWRLQPAVFLGFTVRS